MAEKVKNVVALNSVTLESTEATTQAAALRTMIDTYYSDQMNLSLKYTSGASETLTNCYVKVWCYIGTKTEGTNHPYSQLDNKDIAADTANWIQLGEYSVLAGVATFVPTTYKVAGGTGTTVYTSHFAQGITFSKLRVSAYETGVVANKGTLTAVVSIQ